MASIVRKHLLKKGDAVTTGQLRHHAIGFGAVVLTGALALTGCGAKSASTAPTAKITAGGPDAALTALVPASLKSAGVINIGVDSTYAPAEYLDTDGKTVIGFDVDLFDAVAAKLGLKTKWISSKFDAIIPGIQSGKYDAGVSSFTINADRLKQNDMISYFNAPIQWAVKTGTTGITPDTACGKKVAVQTATIELDDLTKKSTACKTAGKPTIHIDPYQNQSDATAAVISGKDDAGSADYPVFVDAVTKASGQLALLGDPYGPQPYGVVLKKGSTDFDKAVAGAFKDIMTDGTYAKVLDKWKVSKGAITDSVVNPPAS
jgi:polar amino acid transport system substrate-binding protein